MESIDKNVKKDAQECVETVKTNIGDMPMKDYLEMRAREYGFNSFEELKGAGYTIEL